MKKAFSLLLVFTLLASMITGCGSSSDSGKALKEYKTSMETFYSEISKIDKEINSINPESDDAMEKLLKALESLEQTTSNMANLSVPTEDAPETFAYISSLAEESLAYIKQANEYFELAFTENSYNESYLNAAMECYSRANKRYGYIVDLLNGKYPSDENISYTK